jgi:hypothetical protein
MVVKLDLHIHSKHSYDGFLEVEEIVKRAKEIGLGGFALTDHNSIDGIKIAKELAEKENLIFIPGLEISSSDGDVLALGMEQLIPNGLSAEETIDKIHEAGGLAVAPHPFATLFHRICVGDLIRDLKFDAIESFNGRTLSGNKLAKKACNELNFPETAGSDAHLAEEIGNGCTIVDCNSNIQDVLVAIKKGKTQTEGRHIALKTIFKYAFIRPFLRFLK